MQSSSYTLFPYTTLFRSVCKAGGVQIAPEHARQAPGAVRRRLAAAVGRDRKSTRLNSSHMSISYAVFCLKKKKCLQSNSVLLQSPPFSRDESDRTLPRPV